MAQTGFTTLVTLILFLGGVQLIGMGVLGEYLWRALDESRHRPRFIIEATTDINSPTGLSSSIPGDSDAG